MRPAGDVGPYLGNSICIAMAKVGTVVPRCPRIVGEMRIVTDLPTSLRPAGDVGPYLWDSIVSPRSAPSLSSRSSVFFSCLAFQNR